MSQKQEAQSKCITVQKNNLTYSLNDGDETASIIEHYNFLVHDIFVPRSVEYNKKEYIVTKICKNAFNNNLYSIQFPPDSQLQTIDESAFSGSKITSLSLPSSVIELKKGWCHGLNILNKIEIDPNNKRYSVYEEKLIIGKSKIEDDNYNVLVFCVRNIKRIQIPNFIEIIDSFAFEHCSKYFDVDIPSDSRLKVIESYAFYESTLSTLKNLNSFFLKNTHIFHRPAT